jgi:hypothetical protein
MQSRFDASSSTEVPNEDDEHGTIAAEDLISHSRAEKGDSCTEKSWRRWD